MKITMYELIGLIKDNKEPKIIKYKEKNWKYSKKRENYYIDDTISINWDYVIMNCLNDEVEIIEENKEKKIPEKLDFTFEDKFIIKHFKSGTINYLSTIEAIKQLYDKQCEIIDYIKIKGDE